MDRSEPSGVLTTSHSGEGDHSTASRMFEMLLQLMRLGGIQRERAEAIDELWDIMGVDVGAGGNTLALLSPFEGPAMFCEVWTSTSVFSNPDLADVES